MRGKISKLWGLRRSLLDFANYSYRVKYNGLLASFFLSSLEMLSNELALLDSAVFSFLVFNHSALPHVIDY